MTLDEAIGQYTAYVDAEKMGITSFTINTREAEQLAEWLRELQVIQIAIKDGYKLCKVIEVISDASDYAEGMKLAIILEGDK